MTTYLATTTAFVATIMSALFTAFFNLLGTILPYAIGILVFYMGYHWARRALGGR
jgi:hypothetical protein